MSRIHDLVRFYDILRDLDHRLGGSRRLSECTHATSWPQHGVYFFFEEGEVRSDSGAGPRVVRVGTHALTATSRATLWGRLSQHRGSARALGGNHRGSIFRLLVGEALYRRDGPHVSTWGVSSSLGKAAIAHQCSVADIRAREGPLEARVSERIGAMPLLWLSIDDPPGPKSLRGLVERNAIALLSNVGRPPLDPPSPSWLGRSSGRDPVCQSGLWNNRHVNEEHDRSFLDALTELVERLKP